MRLWSPLVLVLLILVPAGTALTGPVETPQAPESGPAGRDAAGLEASLRLAGPFVPELGHPFLMADPARWMPVLAQEGMVEAVSVAVRQNPASTALSPLGDADGDGRKDLLRIVHEEGRTTFTALAGPDLSREIWDLAAPMHGYGHIVGDVDEDGVLDLAFVEVVGEEHREDGGTIDEVASVLSGRDGEVLTDMDLRSEFRHTTESSGLTPFMQSRESRTTFTHQSVADLRSGQAGHDVLTFRFESHQKSENSPLGGSFEGSFSFGSSVARFDGEGQEIWSQDGQDQFVLVQVGDFTDDGVQDLLFLTMDDFTFSYSYGLLDGGSTEASEIRFGAAAVDGVTGKTLWTVDASEGELLVVQFVGEARGDGNEFAVSRSDGQGSEIAFIDATDGAPIAQHTLEGVAVAGPLGDVDRDGDGDLVLLRGEHGREMGHVFTKVEAVDEDLESIWQVETPGQGPAFPRQDLDGDGALDVLVKLRFQKDVSVLSGRTGKALWDVEEDASVTATRLVRDVDRDGGTDLAHLHFPGTDKRTEDRGEHDGHVRLLRGADGRLLWDVQVIDPEWYRDLSAADPGFYIQNAGDIDGNGADDVIVTLRTHIQLHFEDGQVHEEEQPPGDLLSSVIVLEGATGRTLARYDDTRLADGVEPNDLHGNIEVGPAGLDLQASLQGGLLGPMLLGVLLVAGALVVGVLLARRRKDQE